MAQVRPRYGKQDETPRLIWARSGRRIIATPFPGFLPFHARLRSGAMFYFELEPVLGISAWKIESPDAKTTHTIFKFFRFFHLEKIIFLRERETKLKFNFLTSLKLEDKLYFFVLIMFNFTLNFSFK